jgi:hypothetical protein
VPGDQILLLICSGNQKIYWQQLTIILNQQKVPRIDAAAFYGARIILFLHTQQIVVITGFPYHLWEGLKTF